MDKGKSVTHETKKFYNFSKKQNWKVSYKERKGKNGFHLY